MLFKKNGRAEICQLVRLLSEFDLTPPERWVLCIVSEHLRREDTEYSDREILNLIELYGEILE